MTRIELQADDVTFLLTLLRSTSVPMTTADLVAALRTRPVRE